MGIDVNLYAVGEVSDERLAEAEAFLVERELRIAWTTDPADNEAPRPNLRREPDGMFDEERVEFLTFSRYYGPGYERGTWPDIFTAILALRAALPECTVFYGGDTTDYGMECTDEFLGSLWEHWLSPKWDDYFARHRSRAASAGDQ